MASHSLRGEHLGLGVGAHHVRADDQEIPGVGCVRRGHRGTYMLAVQKDH